MCSDDFNVCSVKMRPSMLGLIRDILVMSESEEVRHRTHMLIEKILEHGLWESTIEWGLCRRKVGPWIESNGCLRQQHAMFAGFHSNIVTNIILPNLHPKRDKPNILIQVTEPAVSHVTYTASPSLTYIAQAGLGLSDRKGSTSRENQFISLARTLRSNSNFDTIWRTTQYKASRQEYRVFVSAMRTKPTIQDNPWLQILYSSTSTTRVGSRREDIHISSGSSNSRNP